MSQGKQRRHWHGIRNFSPRDQHYQDPTTRVPETPEPETQAPLAPMVRWYDSEHGLVRETMDPLTLQTSRVVTYRPPMRDMTKVINYVFQGWD